MTRPLDGVRVVDLTHAYAGPLCTYNLALLGADVVKVEPPGSGDDFRVWFENAFLALNAGKRSVELDLSTDEGRGTLDRLLADADVLIENYRPGVAAKLGISWEDLESRFPRLIYCSITGFGGDGVLRDAPGIEWVVQATSGMTDMYLNEDDHPARAGLPVVDAFSGFTALASILAALLLRERVGRGSRLDVAMLDAAFGLLTAPAADAANLWPGRGLLLHGSGRFRARDRWLYVSCVHDKWFRVVCEVVGAPELVEDDRFATAAARARNGEAFHSVLVERFAARDAEEWERELNARGIPAAVVRTLGEAIHGAQAEHRGVLYEVDSDRGRVLVVASPVALSGPPRRGVPTLGAHTSEILSALERS